MTSLNESDLAVAARALRNHADELYEGNVSTLQHINRLRRIADAIDPQKALPIQEVA